jgi:hypothetical protein
MQLPTSLLHRRVDQARQPVARFAPRRAHAVGLGHRAVDQEARGLTQVSVAQKLSLRKLPLRIVAASLRPSGWQLTHTCPGTLKLSGPSLRHKQAVDGCFLQSKRVERLWLTATLRIRNSPMRCSTGAAISRGTGPSALSRRGARGLYSLPRELSGQDYQPMPGGRILRRSDQH